MDEVDDLAKQLFVAMVSRDDLGPQGEDWEYDLAEEAYGLARAFFFVRDDKKREKTADAA